MKPIKKTGLIYDPDALSTEEIGALIEELTATYKERLEYEKRRKKAEEYADKIYNLIIEAKQDNLNVMIGNTCIPDNFRVDVFI